MKANFIISGYIKFEIFRSIIACARKWRLLTQLKNGRPACAGRRARFMYYVYVIKSIANNWYYVGMTNNVIKRIHQHNLAQSTATKAYCPFTLVYSKAFTDRMSARDYEKFLKIHSNKEKLLLSLDRAEVAKW